MLDSNVDDQLSALGQAPSDMRELVTRVLGDQPLTLAHADALLASLTEGRASPLASRPRGAGAAVGAFAGVAARATPLAESPLTASAAPMFDSRPPPTSAAPPVFESRSVSADSVTDPSSVFDGKPDAETTAQAIVAAFDEPDAEQSLGFARRPLEFLTSAVLGSKSSVELEAERKVRRGESRGSRRPDLDELLDEPLDALDFERTEPEPPHASNAERASTSEAPTGAPPPRASGDDFEILVDDEILEIAEDDVELVDDDSN